MEVWKDVIGYEGLYQVSNLGRIKTLGRVTGDGRVYKPKVMSPGTNATGYLYIELRKNGVRKTHRLHRLILQAFDPVEGMEHLDVNHIDEDKKNCRLDNLCWMTRAENLNWGSHNERMAKTQSRQIYCVELDRFFQGIRPAARELGEDPQHIWRALKHPTRTASGYHWRYAK
jgi:hypothetical protein